MKILVVTQKVDSSDSILGFFHGWLVAMASKVESITVICLEKGECYLPDNVNVYSLGKEHKKSRIQYIINFYRYLGTLAGSYDVVFVHMNQEYVLLAGLYWKYKNVPVYLWRNHRYGDVLTRIAVWLSTKVFCTSKQSFTAQFEKTILMPVGVDTTLFTQVHGVIRKKHSVCMIGRISPVKNIDIALHAINELILEGVQVSLSIIGPVPKKNDSYRMRLTRYVSDMNLSHCVFFLPAVAQKDLPKIYSEYDICLNLTSDGSLDKTIIEASSCGTIPVCVNASLRGLLPEVCITERSSDVIARSLRTLLSMHHQSELVDTLRMFAESQSLKVLVDKLFLEMK